ncbi:MAG TPA: phosphatase PAP2 family protein [Flavitalea sp.]|nr:phosphatase PAP2 family protein [Flavitalea sp.]
MVRSIHLIIVAVLVGLVSPAQPIDTLTKPHYRISTGLIAPASLMLSGIMLNGNGDESLKMEIAEERDEKLPSFRTRIDNYLQISPIAIAYGLDAAGIKSRNDLANRTAILLKGEVLTLATAFALKKNLHQIRPDGSDHFSFPSGHTAQAFAAATFLSEEYKHRFHWMPYAAYGIAGSVGVLRMANNKHYISDVLFGAGLGLLSMKISYWTHQYRWGKVHHELVVY